MPPRPPKPPVGPSVPRFTVPVSPAMLKDIQGKVENEFRKTMGIGDAVPLSDDAKKAIAEAVKAASEQQTAAQVSRIAAKHAAQTLGRGVQINEALKSKLEVGLEGIKAVGASNEYQNILKENARMLKAKYDALVAVGFTAEQAFKLIEAEVYAKGGGRGSRP